MKSEVSCCEECDVPEHISKEQMWLSDGSIVQTSNREARITFIESENWDPIWRGIGELIGRPIEDMVISASRRATYHYVLRLVPKEVRELVQRRELDMGPLIEGLLSLTMLMGNGSASNRGYRFDGGEDDYITVRYKRPFSVPMVVGSAIGSTEVFYPAGGHRVEQVSPDVIDVTYYPSEHPEELEGRMRFEPHRPREGNVHLEHCPTCGAPADLAEYKWNLDLGVIRNTSTGRRMTMTGPAIIDPVFAELERELGEDVPRVVIEAQRRFVRSGPYLPSEITSEEEMRRQLAIRGLGELRSIEMGKNGVQLSLESATMHFWVVGLVQGLYELVFGEGSDVEWQVSEDGLLEVAVTPSPSDL